MNASDGVQVQPGADVAAVGPRGRARTWARVSGGLSVALFRLFVEQTKANCLPTTAGQLGLISEFRIFLHPVPLGQGRPVRRSPLAASADRPPSRATGM